MLLIMMEMEPSSIQTERTYVWHQASHSGIASTQHPVYIEAGQGTLSLVTLPDQDKTAHSSDHPCEELKQSLEVSDLKDLQFVHDRSEEYVSIQYELSKFGTSLGYEVQLNYPISPHFHLPVHLEDARMKVAIYIPEADHHATDVNNLAMCLREGYSRILVTHYDKKRLAKIHGQLKKKVDERFHQRFCFGQPKTVMKQLSISTAYERPLNIMEIQGAPVSVSYAMTDRESLVFKEITNRLLPIALQRSKESA